MDSINILVRDLCNIAIAQCLKSFNDITVDSLVNFIIIKNRVDNNAAEQIRNKLTHYFLPNLKKSGFRHFTTKKFLRKITKFG